MKEMICIVCPVGCHLTADADNNISGNRCVRGAKYGLAEVTNPTRTLTTTLRTTSLMIPRLSVKTSTPISKGLIFEALSYMNTIIIDKNVKIGDVVIENMLNTGVNMVATKNIEI
jgi:CxxC motif-containing protein